MVAELFILLKLTRLSAVDLDDCLGLVEHCKQSGEGIERARIRARIDALPPTEDAALVGRRARLRDVLGDVAP